jgi:uncharacterized oxidoreductase
MQLKGNTILITGGSSGIGLELAQQLTASGNKVLICGRSEDKLRTAKMNTPELDYFCCDLALQAERENLIGWIREYYPECNLLINNAAVVYNGSFHENTHSVHLAESEFQTNVLGPIHLIHALLPLISRNKNPQIVTVTTGLIYAPRVIYPFYNATKAALHAFTLVLREQLFPKGVRVTEVLFPVVNTPWHKGKAPAIAISPEKAVCAFIQEWTKGKTEIRVGKVRLLYILSRISPGFAFRKINSL